MAKILFPIMSDIVIFLKLEPYLAQWLMHEHGGNPVVFPKNSAENDILELGLTLKPYLAIPNQPGDDKVPIAVPYFKSKDVRSYNYLPPSGRRALARCIRTRFVIALWNDLYRFGNIGKRKQDIIWAWMEARGIESTETNWNTIAKIYMRKRSVYRKQKWRDDHKEQPPTTNKR